MRKSNRFTIVASVLVLGVAATVFVTSSNSNEWSTEALHRFVQTEVKNVSAELFATDWQVHYVDVTGDGELEAILVENYTMDWYPYVEVVSKTQGRYQTIPGTMHAGKYGTEIEWRDGFLVVTATAGGPGEQLRYMNLFVYANGEMVQVMEDLLMYQRVSFPTHDFEVTGEITGALTEFDYRQAKFDFLTEDETVELVQSYQYDQLGKHFRVADSSH